MGTVVELDSAPSPGRLYGRAALGLLSRRSARTLPDTTVVRRDVAVERARLTGYERVCGFPVGDLLPATYPHVMAFPLALRLMSGPDFPFPVAGVIHLANRVELLRPIDANQRLTLAVDAVNLRPHHRGRQFDVRANATVDGEVVWRGVSTYLHRERPAQPEPPAHGDWEPPPATAIWRVGPNVGRDYAAVSGDLNPIHTSRLGARAFGFRRPIAHGMWTMARSLAALSGRLADTYAAEVSFKVPVPLPSRVAFAATRVDEGWSVSVYDPVRNRPNASGLIRTAFS